MKKISLCSLLILVSGIALADNAASPRSSPRVGPEPCRKVIQACRRAGFYKGGSEAGKGLYENCLRPLLAGQTVQGVSVDAPIIEACQQRSRRRNEAGNAEQPKPAAGNAGQPQPAAGSAQQPQPSTGSAPQSN